MSVSNIASTLQMSCSLLFIAPSSIAGGAVSSWWPERPIAAIASLNSVCLSNCYSNTHSYLALNNDSLFCGYLASFVRLVSKLTASTQDSDSRNQVSTGVVAAWHAVRKLFNSTGHKRSQAYHLPH